MPWTSTECSFGPYKYILVKQIAPQSHAELPTLLTLHLSRWESCLPYRLSLQGISNPFIHKPASAEAEMDSVGPETQSVVHPASALSDLVLLDYNSRGESRIGEQGATTRPLL